MEFHRIQVSHQIEIQTSAANAWELLTDWSGILRWWPKHDAPIALEKVLLLGEEGKVPRTREMHVKGDIITHETLLLQDDAAYRIYYDMEQNEVIPVRNYLATTAIDEITAKSCSLFFSSHCDANIDTNPEHIKSGILSVYQAIGRGFKDYFSVR